MKVIFMSTIDDSWPELTARIALAKFRLFGDSSQLSTAKVNAYHAGICAAYDVLNGDGPGPKAPPLIREEDYLYRRWKSGLLDGVAMSLESRQWKKPCQCEPETDYRCPNHVEATETAWYMGDARLLIRERSPDIAV